MEGVFLCYSVGKIKERSLRTRVTRKYGERRSKGWILMEEVTLKANKREIIGKKVKLLRRQGILPAVIYGRKTDSVPISLDEREVNRVLATISSSHLINLDIDGETLTTLIRDRQRHPVTGSILHIDFYEVSMTEKLTTAVNIIIRGESPAAKNLGGILVTGQETLEVECLPQDLPERFVVDISKLGEIGDTVYVRDIVIPSEVDLLTDPDEMVIVITAPAAEEEEIVEEVEITDEEPEVIERGKRDEEGEAEGESEGSDEE